MNWITKGSLVAIAFALVSCHSDTPKPLADNQNSNDANQQQQQTFLFPDKPASNYEHLKDLEWMIGKWKDTSDDFDIVNNVTWDKYKNFIINRFTVDEGNKE